MTRRWRLRGRAGMVIGGITAAALLRASSGQAPVWRDDLAASQWRGAPAAGVELVVASQRDEWGTSALRLDFDYRGHGGWAAVRLPLDLALPENWELRFRVRGEAPRNHLEIKFVDPSGENVWWSVRRGLSYG